MKAILWLGLMAAVVVFCVKYVPVKLATAEFYDFMNEQSKFAQQATPDQLKRTILDKAVQLRLPIEQEQCRVEKPGDRIVMQCEYDIEVDFIVVKNVYHFAPIIDQPIFIF